MNDRGASTKRSGWIFYGLGAAVGVVAMILITQGRYGVGLPLVAVGAALIAFGWIRWSQGRSREAED